MLMLKRLTLIFTLVFISHTAHADGMWRVKKPDTPNTQSLSENERLFHSPMRIDVSTLEFSETFPANAPKHAIRSSRAESPFIVGGDNASKNDFPEYGSLWWDARDGYIYFACGGTWVGDDEALTAAHCVEDYNADRFYFAPQTHKFSTLTGADFLKGWRKKIHPDYHRRRAWDNDVAILQTFQSNPTAPRAKLIETKDPLIDFNATAVGLGALSTNGGNPSVLQKVNVGIISNEQCQIANQSTITDSMICAGTPQGGKDSCFGDSGGPLFAKINNQRLQVGIVSWGVDGCATKGRYGVYARISKLADFIDSKVTTAEFVEYTPPSPPAEDDILDLVIPILAKAGELTPPD